MRFAKHLKHVAVVVLHIGQSNDWHKLKRHETELQSAFDFRDQKKNTIGRATALPITKTKITDHDRRILSLREKGLWASEIAAVLGITLVLFMTVLTACEKLDYPSHRRADFAQTQTVKFQMKK